MFWLDKPIYLPFPGHQIFKLRAASINWRQKEKKVKKGKRVGEFPLRQSE